MSHGIMDFVSNVANEVSQRLPQALESLPASIQETRNKNLDVTSITDRILATSKPAEAPIPTRNDTGRGNALKASVTSTNATNASSLAGSDSSQQHHNEPNQPQHVSSSSSRPKPGTNPGTLSTWLSRRCGTKYLAINLSEEYPDDRTLLLLNRQVLTKGWSSPCLSKSETPRLPHILDICYCIHAYLSLDPQNVILVYCANGRTRTAIVIAAYLRYARMVPTALQGFQLFLSKRCPHLDPNATLNNIPPSLITFFRNFDSSLQLGTVMNPKPLLLRAIAVQGVPVDDKPCIDIWDSSSGRQHVYASRDNDALSQWADEEGFYRVNCVLQGDFLLLCRFGGPYMDETNDPSKVLFRYANTTGFLASGPYELPLSRVDMMRRYVASFDSEDFGLTLLFESYWDCTDETLKPQLQQECSDKVMPPVLLPGRNAKEKGWHLITQQHAARPERADVDALKQNFTELQDCPPHICKLALQLTNFDGKSARDMLYVGSMKSWWRQQDEATVVASERHAVAEESQSENDPPPPPAAAAAASVTKEPARVVPDPQCLEILKIVDSVVGTGGDSHVPLDGGAPTQQEASNDATTTSQRDDPLMLYEGIMFPNRGDIVNMFGDYYKNIHGNTGKPRLPPRGPLELGCKPRLPLIPRKRIRPQDEEQAKKRPAVDPFGQIGGFHNPGGANGDLVYDEDFMAALEIYQQINHTGVTLEDLRQTLTASGRWNYIEEPSTTNPVESKKKKRKHSSKFSGENGSGERRVGLSIEESAAHDSSPLVDGNELSMGVAIVGEAGALSVGVSPPGGGPTGVGHDAIAEGGPPAGIAAAAAAAAIAASQKRADLKDGTGNGSSSATVNGEKSKTSASEGAEAATKDKDCSADDVPLKLDPEYQKVGLPMDAVKHAMKRDEKDPSIMDLDHNKSLKFQMKEKAEDKKDSKEKTGDGPALKDDPEYAKYFKMLKMGLPMDAVKHAMKRDEKDPSIMDLDHDKSLKSQKEEAAEESDGPPLGEDPDYVKYWKMLKMGLPAGAVKNALQRDGKDPSIIDLDPTKSLKSQSGGPVEEKDDGPPLCEDPQFTKYFKMLKMGLPVDAVKNALQRDGKDPTIMDLDHNKSLKSQTKNEVIDTGIALKDDPEFAKYFKMLKMGLPMGAVKNALQRDDKDPTIMDLDPDKSVTFQLSQKSGRLIHRKKEKKRVRRKKIYWTPIDPGKVNEESIWSMVRGSVEMDKLKYDPKEFENLFTESSNPADKKKAAARKDKSKQQKKAVQVIDGKRSMNGGIILARLKMEYSKIAEMVDVMDSGKFDSTQLSALKEFLPTQDERKALEAFMKKGDSSPQAMAEALSGLSECEKYMVAMMKVDNAASKFDCMLFRVQFKGRVDELIEGINIVNKACDEVRSSDRLRKMMAMILTLVNQINTGGDGNMAVGFSLDALLKLNEAKAFDKKTSVLQYLVKLVKQNDESLMDFKNDIESVPEAGGVLLDALGGDVKVLADEVKQVHETAKVEADRLEAEGKLRKMSLAELSEQITVVRQIGGLSHYNQIDHITGRTQMERFASRATSIIDNAVDALEDLKKTYIGVLSYFGEDEQMPSNDFFGTMKKFTLEFKSAAEAVEKQEKARLKEQLRAAAKKAVAASRVASIASSPSKGKKNVPGKQMMGDIASMAASQAKLKRSAKLDPGEGKADGDDNAKGSFPGGGIAAMAAAAALKRRPSDTGEGERTNKPSGESESSSGTSPVLSPVGGIAAVAALAARNREKSVKEGGSIDSESTKSSSPSPAGGIAAAAAMAARHRSDTRVEETEASPSFEKASIPSPMAGIAAAAAQAARTREDKASKQDDKDVPSTSNLSPMGDIAAAAAKAARAREEKVSQDDDKDVSSTSNQSPMVGIAAAAAQAARAREEKASSRQDDDKDGPSTSSISPMRGIAAAAAQAARGRKEKAPTQDDEDDSSIEKTSNPSPMGGIAAAAAQAARARDEKASSKQDDDKDGPNTSNLSPMGGIAAAAAQAARARNEKASSNQDDDKDGPNTSNLSPIGGIAAAAAQAARARKEKAPKQDDEDDSSIEKTSNPSPIGDTAASSGGGIASLAAAAARNRRPLQEENDSDLTADDRTGQSVSEETKPEDSADGKTLIPPAIGGGGIAALAAAAARKRRKPEQFKPKDSHDGENSSAPTAIGGGGIAAAAAAAARKRQSVSEETESKDSTNRESSSSQTAIGGGGIAALAAAAARSRQSVSEETEPKDSTNRESSSSQTAIGGGGIAALAAAAARKRQSQSEEIEPKDSTSRENPRVASDGGGITAAAAAAARNRQTEKTVDGDNDVDTASQLGDGIAAMAARAARNRLTSTQKVTEAREKVPSASEGATATSQHATEVSNDEGTSGESVDSEVATTQVVSTNEDPTDSKIKDDPIEVAKSDDVDAFDDAVVEDVPQGRLKVESDDDDEFFAAEESLPSGSPRSRESTGTNNVEDSFRLDSGDVEHNTELNVLSDSTSSSWLGRHLSRSLSSRSHEANDLPMGSPQSAKKTSRSAPASPTKVSPKSSGGISRWMPRFASQADSEIPAAPDITSSASADSTALQSQTTNASIEPDGQSSPSSGRKSPLQRIMKRSHAKRNLTPKGKGKDESKDGDIQQYLSDVDNTSGEFGA